MERITDRGWALRLNRPSGWFAATGLLALMTWTGAVCVGWFAPAVLGIATVLSGGVGVVLLLGGHPRRWFLASALLGSLAVVAELTVGWFAPAAMLSAALCCSGVGTALAARSRWARRAASPDR
ncbi:hypothetical protein [Clavibacter sp. VKM Ac-2872]|uniref:hypothetical protein n=1 Tax=Clavibacter sp. VKM Ac-2872 TaxID=2783812 RepID=UPI00188C0895|nr:hypothetical protein [Clavibacter sp. VKM Ac-2872]MBF4625790.1 hypothetical protein [Clavibacter sp. VKM Ac-2872]